ncbi:DNA-directed RNA polymerase sigma-70 factor [Reticulibacter mediterranei]|uniref:DNA-directed RNA polymerase sigma-70 factor n=1 Tax=Reticulibacter mediterranei TaxID=2778369 RepID=A0A8J3MWU2_9CHLR|nr:sigma-70 family RNA polymerase sigma factor [Reticulibacter mediterranei]GHO90219.1 DNA-directed RNA polymerase sigma-70 factor [Reticulibacter mediterranei]
MYIVRKNKTQEVLQIGTDGISELEAISDEALMQAIASGDVWAMEMLYTRYHRPLYSVAYRIVADQQVAEDVLQESFLAVWRRAVSYLPQNGEVRNWLFSIVRHRAIDYLRGLRRRAALRKVPLEDVEHDEQVALPDVWDETWLAVQCSQIREALISLPKEQRLVIELAYFQGRTQAEIAESYQISLGTVKGRIRSGLLHLKHILESKGFSDPIEAHSCSHP